MRYNLFGITPGTGQWRWSEQRSLIAIENYKEMVKEIGKNKKDITQEEIDTWYKKKVEETGEELDLLRLSSNKKPEHYVPPSETRLASNLWYDLKPNGSSQVKAIFGKKVFDNPKSTDLIRRIIKFVEGDKKDSLILDSFAGSGTTMHAVMDLNKEDGGNRQCILVQMTEATDAEPKKNICKDITRERIKSAIDKYGYDSGFKYFRVGIPIDAESLLSGKLPTFKQFAEYVYYLCTGEHIKDKSAINEKTYFVGSINNSVIYLVYKQNFDELTRLALNLPLAEKIIVDNPRKKIIVYAPACFLEEDYMKDNNIEFVGIPYNLFRRENGA